MRAHTISSRNGTIVNRIFYLTRRSDSDAEMVSTFNSLTESVGIAMTLSWAYRNGPIIKTDSGQVQ